jgi:hypothetical protein
MKGGYVYCSDEETADYFRARLAWGIACRGATMGIALWPRLPLLLSTPRQVHRESCFQDLLREPGDLSRQIRRNPHDVVPVPRPDHFEPLTSIPIAATQERLQLGHLVLKNV